MNIVKNMFSKENPYNIREPCCVTASIVFITIGIAVYYVACSFMAYPLLYAVRSDYNKSTGCPYTNPDCGVTNTGCYEGHYNGCFIFGMAIALGIPLVLGTLICIGFCGHYIISYLIMSYRSADNMTDNTASDKTVPDNDIYPAYQLDNCSTGKSDTKLESESDHNPDSISSRISESDSVSDTVSNPDDTCIQLDQP